MKYLGNPNISVSTIDVATNGIVASRTSGELPAFVQVSASGVLGTGTVANGTTLNPYEDFEYSWDFGEPSGAEIFFDPVTGLHKNANYQKGPEAAYVYRTAGSKTITLTVRACTAPPTAEGLQPAAYVTATKTLTFTASVFDKSGGEFWFDSVGGSDSNNGTSSVTPKQTIAALNTLLAQGHTQIWLRRGSNWVGQTGIANAYSDLRIGAYGSGAQPIINMLNATTNGNHGAIYNPFSSDNANRATSNIVISNIDFWRSGTTGNSIINVYNLHHTNAANDIYFDNLNLISDNSSAVTSKWLLFQYNEAGAMVYPNSTNVQRTGIWGGSFDQTVSNLGGEVGYYGGARHWNFFFGVNPFKGSGTNSLLDHHIYPNFQSHALFRWMNFGSGTNRNFALDVNFNSQGGGYELGQYWLIAENNFTGTANGHDCSNGNSVASGSAGLSDFTNFVVQQNAFHGLSQSAANFGNCISMTWRYNRIWMMPAGSYPLLQVISSGAVNSASAAEMGINFKFYGNWTHQSNAGSQTSGISPINQKSIFAVGTADWSNGSGGAGALLNTTALSNGTIVPGYMVLTTDASAPSNAKVQAYGTGGTDGIGSTGHYSLTQSALVASGSTQFVLGWTTPWTITDNIVYDASVNPVLMDLQFTNQATATVDRNKWYAPNGGLATSAGAGTPFFDNRFPKTFAQYKAAGFGTHDVVGDPGWVDPANGAFDAASGRVLFEIRNAP